MCLHYTVVETQDATYQIHGAVQDTHAIANNTYSTTFNTLGLVQDISNTALSTHDTTNKMYGAVQTLDTRIDSGAKVLQDSMIALELKIQNGIKLILQERAIQAECTDASSIPSLNFIF